MGRRFAFALALGVAVGGCAGCAVHIPPLEGGPVAALPPADLAEAMPAQVGVSFRSGNAVTWSENGEVFDDIARLIGRAQHSVNIVTFIWRPGAASDRVLVPLMERARAGVTCRVLVDRMGSPRFEEQVKPLLERAGCEVRIHRPLHDDVVERNHRKIVVVDGASAVVGGFGIWKSWEGNGRSRDEWRDTNAVVRGPVVRDLQRAFEVNWRQAGGEPLPESDLREPPRAGRMRAAFVASSAIDLDGGEARTRAERSTELLIRSARHRLWIANSYFVPEERILSLLVTKARAGVDVRILAPGPVHDWTSIRAAQRNGYPDLLAAGIQIYEYQPSMMHSKTMLVDDHLVVVGSTNLDPLSLRQMEEGSLVVDDPALAAQLSDQLQEDFLWSKRIDHPTVGPYGWASRLVLWLIGRL